MKEMLETQTMQLPEGFTVRGATLADADLAFAMFNAWAQRVIGENDFVDAEVIREDWSSPKFDPARDIRLVFAPTGELVGYTEVWTNSNPPVHPWIWGRVHPDYWGMGIALPAHLGRGTRLPRAGRPPRRPALRSPHGCAAHCGECQGGL
jgi:RimJ/RimL family protein N-acetyltransferase